MPDKVGELVGEIAAASNEQAQGIEQVNTAVTEMDKVIQQNAANAEESAVASEEMNAQAEEMKAMVNELVDMVGGRAGRTTMTHGRPARGKGPMAHRGDSRKTNALPAPKRSQAARKNASPEEILPLDEKDFEDF